MSRRVSADPLCLGLLILACACGPGRIVAPDAGMAVFKPLSPDVLPPPPADITNRYADDPAAAKLGQRFFFDPGFSGPLLDSDNTGLAGTLGKMGQAGRVACAGCHVPSAGFLDNRSFREQISLGAQWGMRRAPSLLGVGQTKLLMWDGRRDAFYNQVFTPLESRAEMNSSRLYMAEQIYARYQAPYEAIFGPLPPLNDTTRFPALDGAHAGCESTFDGGVGPCHGVPGDGAEFDGMAAADQDAVTRVAVNFGKVMEAYLRLLTCGPSRFDAWVHGDGSALTPNEKDGAFLFVGKAGCAGCHQGPYLTDQKFHNVGLKPGVAAIAFYDLNDHGALPGLTAALSDPLNTKGGFSDGDDGRLPTSVDSSMDGAFRTPSLRCVGMRPSLMHTGQFRGVDDVVNFFNRGGDSSGYPGTSENWARNLSTTEVADLEAFLHTLDGPGPAADLMVAPP